MVVNMKQFNDETIKAGFLQDLNGIRKDNDSFDYGLTQLARNTKFKDFDYPRKVREYIYNVDVDNASNHRA